MSTLRELKSRISSVGSTQKTTSAMKMISSAKMRKAMVQLQRLSPYRNMVQNVLAHLLATGTEFASPLTAQRDVHNVALVAFGSDDGLCGAFNINIFKQLLNAIEQARQQWGNNVGILLLPIGKKLTKAADKLHLPNLTVEHTAYLHTRSNTDDLHRFTDELRQRFENGNIDRVDVLYMHFISTGKQRFTQEQLLPVSVDALAENTKGRGEGSQPCLFEPSAQQIFEAVMPLHLRSMVQDVFTQSAASEQAARVMAMQTASDNAAELLESLNLEYNKLRQQSITTELLDILGGQVQR